MTVPCSSCEHHFAKSNQRPGKLIPHHHGKCTRPEGLCDEHYEHEEAMRKESQAFLEDDAPAIIPEISDERSAELAQTQNTAAAVDQAVMDAEEVHTALGRIEGLEFLRRVGDVAIAQIFAEVRKSKKYKGLPYKDENGHLRHVADFEEFCSVKLGKSYRRCHELAQNLNMLGSDLYESAETIGFRAKDYRALKALPPEEQEVVKTALASDSKDEVVDILQDMAARHQAEKEAAKKEKDDLTADLDARGKLLKDKAEKLEQTEEELYRLKSLPKDANLELKLAREEEATNELNKAFVTALGAFNEMLMQVDAITENEDVSSHTKAYGFDQVRAFCIDIQANIANYGIPVDFEEMVNPAWMKEEAKTGLEEG
ncbi:MAG: hypothetical protein CL942_08680 [Desulfovibrio sp.]|nr:hypothetical protein [Desulfovibrio sp.]|tara:strand:- start:2690 stop:3802 length:1113 start_codon:yes stop_codon:yes gene_type:complete